MASSALGRLSTWQLGVKHSITKRCTRGPYREVRLPRVAGPSRVRAPYWTLSVQVERGLGAWSAKGCAVSRSWLKSNGLVRGNRSVNRRISTGMPTAPVRSRAYPAAWHMMRRRVLVARHMMRCRLSRAQPCRAPLGPAQQHPARPRHRGQTEGRAGGARQRGPVPDEDDRNQDAAEGRPADHVAHRVLAGGGAGGGCPGGGLGRGRGSSGHGGAPWGGGLRGFNACSSRRSRGLPRGALGSPGGCRGPCVGRGRVWEGAGRAVPRSPIGALYRTGASLLGERCANRLYGAATIALRASSRACSLEPSRGESGIWAEEACRRTLGGMGLGR